MSLKGCSRYWKKAVATVFKVLLDVALILREQRVEHNLPPADVDGRAEVFFEFPTRRLQIPLGGVRSGPPVQEQQVPNVAVFELRQIRKAGPQDVGHTFKLLVDEFQVAHGEESSPAHRGVPGDLFGFASLPLEGPVVAGDGELALDDVPLHDEAQLEGLELFKDVALHSHPALQAVHPLDLHVIHLEKKRFTLASEKLLALFTTSAICVT
ncbi:hypothetical protein EYF80_040343 [Liparis tanakae]|uniref:Uncharacterized protein n=1 Tax=Liparis tanakae TaxID=230148 RepID=A0A4Z2G7A5_9TELE|nr:hypothetical protein EYF80_040343 [Liparis tanakae]